MTGGTAKKDKTKQKNNNNNKKTRKLTAEGQRLVSEGSYLLKICHFGRGVGVGNQLPTFDAAKIPKSQYGWGGGGHWGSDPTSNF